MMSESIRERRNSIPLIQSLELGGASGVMAGLAFLLAECAIARLVGGQIESPLRLPGAVIYGPAALGGYFPIWRAAMAGVGINLAVSAILGVAWVLGLRRMGWLQASPFVLAPIGVAYGSFIWLVGDVLLGALAFPQVAVTDLLWGGIFSHAIFFGGTLAVAVLVFRSDVVEA